MSDIDETFFELIRVAIGTQNSLSRLPSQEEWKQIYDLAKKQSLVGICFAGLQRLGADADEGFERIGMSETQYLVWLGMSANIQRKNEIVNKQCEKLQERMDNEGVTACILKGQGVALLYNTNLRALRQSGDIDVYVNLNSKDAYDLACKFTGGVVAFEYKHLPISIFENTEVELHYIPEILFNPLRMSKLKKWYKAANDYCFVGGDCGFNTPSSQFNLVFILLHAYRHLLAGGIGLRQMMDYYFVLQAAKSNSLKYETNKTLQDLGLMKFASGVMWIMLNVFGLSEQLQLCEPDEKEGRFILEEVMASGNFGHHDERFEKSSGSKSGFLKYIIRRNMHLLSHYPSEILCVPLYYIWHFFWKRWNKPL